ncbi:MAG: pilin [bacterium]|nr:pilin [bacterium]
MKQKRKIAVSIFLLVLVGTFFLSSVSQAALVDCGRSGTDNPCELKDMILILIRVINILIGLSWLVAIWFVFWAGFNMIDSSGNEEKITAAKTSFKNAIIGFFLIMLSFLIVNVVVSMFGGYSLDPSSNNSIYKFLPFP